MAQLEKKIHAVIINMFGTVAQMHQFWSTLGADGRVWTGGPQLRLVLADHSPVWRCWLCLGEILVLTGPDISAGPWSRLELLAGSLSAWLI